MSKSSIRHAFLAMSLIGMGALAPLPVLAQAKPDPATETPEEKAEREGRRACAVQLCGVMHNKKPATGDVTCSVRKTWQKEYFTNIMSKASLSWPWGNARCGTNLKFDRALLVKAMSEKEFEAQFETHEVNCELDREAEKYQLKMEIKPKVTFKDGKAVKAALNWGKIEAPTLAKSALWSATAADNTFGVFQNTVVEDINRFLDEKCTEVKDDWQGK